MSGTKAKSGSTNHGSRRAAGRVQATRSGSKASRALPTRISSIDRSLPATGWVRDLWEGRKRVVAAGETVDRRELDSMLRTLRGRG